MNGDLLVQHFPKALVAQQVIHWLANLEVAVLILNWGGILCNGVSLPTAFDYHPPITLIWSKYCWKRYTIAYSPSSPEQKETQLTWALLSALFFFFSSTLWRALVILSPILPFNVVITLAPATSSVFSPTWPVLSVIFVVPGNIQRLSYIKRNYNKEAQAFVVPSYFQRQCHIKLYYNKV